MILRPIKHLLLAATLGTLVFVAGAGADDIDHA
jgi:hypothetical protein